MNQIWRYRPDIFILVRIVCLSLSTSEPRAALWTDLRKFVRRFLLTQLIQGNPHMNKILAALIAGLFAAGSFAAASAPEAPAKPEAKVEKKAKAAAADASAPAKKAKKAKTAASAASS